MSNDEQQQQVPDQTPPPPDATQDAAPQEQAAPIKIDMSKSTPIGQQAAPIKVDMSKSTPIAAPSGVLTPPSGGTTMSARPNDFHSWLQDFQGDVKNGTATTWVGSMLKKMGAKGTEYGVAPGVAKMMPGVSALTGVPQALEGAIDVKRAVEPTLTDIAHGESPLVAASSHGEDAKKLQIAANKTVGGAFEAVGPLAMANPAALAVITPAMAAQQVAVKAAEAMGADPDTQEMVGNAAAIVAGHQVHAALNPVIERFGIAVNNRTAAEVEYTNRARNLETARGNAAEMQKRALDAADRETRAAEHQAGAPGSSPTIGSPAETDAARQLANEAAKNVGDAQKAFDQASTNRADATIELEKLHRQIKSADDKTKAAEYERTASDSKKATDLIKQAVPSKGTTQYSDEDLDRALAHTEAAKRGGVKITDLPSFYNALEEGREGIEKNLFEKAEPYKDEPLVSEPADTKPEDSLSPKNIATQKLVEMAAVDGNFDDAAKTLDKFKTAANPTVGETIDLITKLNNYQRAAMKGVNNWDIGEMIETDPEFAANYFLVEALRDGLHNNLEGHGIEGSREARSETASLARVRNAVGAQERANRGGVAIRGTGSQSKLGVLVSKLIRKGGATVGAVVGGEVGGIHGAIGGAAIGEAGADPLADYFSPRAKTRNETIAKAMKYKGTARKPAQITGEGTPAKISPTLPPLVAAPEPVALTPRENEDLHAELIANSTNPDAATMSYQELEDDFKKDIAAMKKNGKMPEGDQKRINLQIEKADAADRKINAAVAKAPEVSNATAAPALSVEDILSAADDRDQNGRPTTVNPHLLSVGRADESALVSHSQAVGMEAHEPAAEVENLPAGVTSQMAHVEEFSHHTIHNLLRPDGSTSEGQEIISAKNENINKGGALGATYTPQDYTNMSPEDIVAHKTFLATQKMAGPASKEVFFGWSKEDAMTHPSNRGDVSDARRLLREANPDATPTQINEQLDAIYETARKTLAQPHVAERIRANAAVREKGLPDTLHASRGRILQFNKDMTEAHNEATGGNSGPTGGESPESGKKAEKPAAEDGKKNGRGEEGGRDKAARGDDGGNRGDEQKAGIDQSTASKTPELRVPYKEGRTPPNERSVSPEADEKIRKGGGIPGGVQKGDPEIGVPDLAFIHDPTTGSSLALPPDKITPESVKKLLQESRDKYLKGEPQNSRIPKPGQPGYDPEIHGKAEQSNIDHDEVLENIKRAYGVHDDPKLEHAGGFITPEGRYIDLPIDHSDAIARHGGESSGDGPDNRKNFINESKAIRVHSARERGGKVLAFSVPADGVSAVQADAMARSFGANGDRNGILRMERADISPETRNLLHTEKEFPSASDVKPMLQKIQALEQSNLDKGDQVAAHEKDGGSTFTPEGENLAGKDLYSVGAHPDRTLSVDKLTPEILEKFKTDNADLLSQGDRAVGTWKDPDTGKTVLDITKLYGDRDAAVAAVAAGQAANQKAIYHLGGEGEIPTGGTGESKPQITPHTPDAKISYGVGGDDSTFKIATPSGASQTGYVGGQDFPNQGFKKTRGELFLAEVPPSERGQGLGKSLAIDGLRVIKAHGGETVNIAPTSEAGRALVSSLIRDGHISEPIQTSETGKSEYQIMSGGTGEGALEQSNVSKSPKGSTVPLMKKPLEVEGSGDKGKVNTFDVAAALNDYSQEKNPALPPGSDPKKMTARAQSIAEDEAKYQLAQGRTGKEWYTEEMKDHDKTVQEMRPELTQGPSIDAVPGHTAKLTIFKAAEAIASAGQNPYNNLGTTMRLWDAYHETGEFPPNNSETPSGSWGPRGAEAYGNALDSLNRLIKEKGEKGAADWLLADHTVKELRDYNKNVPGVMTTSQPGAMIFGDKRGPFMQNLHGIEAAFTADMWVSRSWNRWMGTLEEPITDKGGKVSMRSDAPRNGAERGLMKESFEHVAKKLGLTTSSLQAVLWYYEQGLYSAHGAAKKSLSFSDAAKRVQSEEAATPEMERNSFNFGDNEKQGGLANLGSMPVLPSKYLNLHGAK
jgi:hypothetical protein